jgi:hypothetical protein
MVEPKIKIGLIKINELKFEFKQLNSQMAFFFSNNLKKSYN